jgi:uncharacterized protein (TIGR02646 family)
MRAITKGPEPPSLTAHRQTQHCDYENYADKPTLRDALVTEQRGLCCYCMGRMRNGPTLTIKIEHWRSQGRYPTDQLTYRNLLGACPGGEGQPLHLQHCDTRKADSDLLWNPAEPVHHVETRIRYEMDGSIRADDVEFDEQLGEILNLNLPWLMKNRQAVLDGILAWWRASRPVPRPRIAQERERYGGGNGELTPYAQIAVWWLDQKLARMTV